MIVRGQYRDNNRDPALHPLLTRRKMRIMNDNQISLKIIQISTVDTC